MEVVDSLETEGMTVTELLKVCLEASCQSRSLEGHTSDLTHTGYVSVRKRFETILKLD